jgi:arylsulfatase A-like enzyme
VRFPGRLAAATVSEQPIAIQDLFPTLCAATGVPLPAEARCDGVDLWPALLAGRVDDRPPFVIATADRACLAGDWKLVVSVAGNTELFHLGTDPGETHDLRAAEPGVAAILRSRLAEIEAGFAAPAGRAPPLRRAVRGEAAEGEDRRSAGGG